MNMCSLAVVMGFPGLSGGDNMTACRVGRCCHLQRDGSSIFPQNLRHACGGVCVEVKRLVDVLILKFGHSVGSAVITWVVQCINVPVFPMGYERVFLDRTEMVCRGKIGNIIG